MKAEDTRLLGQTQKTLLLMAKHKNISILAPITLPLSPTGVRRYGSDRRYMCSRSALVTNIKLGESTNFIANNNEVCYLIS